MSDEKNLKPSSIDGKLIKKIFSIIIFACIGYVVFLGLIILAVGQLLFCAFSGNKNKSLFELSKGLSAYLTKIINYISFQSEEQPFPS